MFSYPHREGPPFDGGARRAFAVGKEAGGFEAVGHAQALAGPVDVLVDGVLADAELAGDLFGGEMTVDEPQNLAFPRGQAHDQMGGIVVNVSHLTHRLTTSDA